MGLAKELQMKLEDRGYGEDDSPVCSYCIGSEELKALIMKEGSQRKCAFCGKIAKCITVEMLCGEIREAIGIEYEKAVDRLGWSDGEYVGKTWATAEILLEPIQQ